MSIVAIIAFALLVVSIIYLPKIRQFYRLLKFSASLPGPKFGEIFTIDKEKFFNWLMQLSEKNGSVFRIWVGKRLVVYFSDVDDIKQIANSRDLLTKSDRYELLKSWMGNGLFLSDGESWRRRRKLLTPAFHFGVLSEFKEPIDENCRILVSRLHEHVDGPAFDINPYLTLFALDVICETAMGIKKEAQMRSSSEYVHATETVCRLFEQKSRSFWEDNNIFYNYTAAGRELRRSIKVLHAETDRVIKLRRQYLQESNMRSMAEVEKLNDDIGSKRRLPFLDMLLIGQMEAVDNGLTDHDIREEVDTFMFAGHDTTSSTLAFAIYFLSQNADVQRMAYEEACALAGKEKDHMPYLEAVIKETLRLYPVTAHVSRKANNDIKIGKLVIPKGATVVMLIYVIHRNKEYFPEPEKFRPERFLQTNDQTFHPFTYLPFSAGPRNCIGQKYAMLEMKCCISHLLRTYEFLPPDNFKPIPIPQVVTKSANGIQVKITLRK